MLASQVGWVGVNLFFVLSGFLITGILLDSKGHPSYMRSFYLGRALRILPAYYCLLCLLAILRQSTGPYLGFCFFYLANVTTLFGIAEDYGPLWSLAVEEHYYLLWPAIVARLSRRSLARTAIAVCVLTALLRGVSFSRGNTVGIASFTWLVADGLAIGSLLAIAVRQPFNRRQMVRLCISICLSGCAAVGVGARWGILTRTRVLGAALQYTVLHTMFAGILLAFLLVGTSRWKRCVNNSCLRFMGYISYGLYLVHLLAFRTYDRIVRYLWPTFMATEDHFMPALVRFFIATGCAIIVAYLSRKYFEEPFLRLKHRRPTASMCEKMPGFLATR
jgi:peptidoglycan/LPS O-acetylase OafA/YrhL